MSFKTIARRIAVFGLAATAVAFLAPGCGGEDAGKEIVLTGTLVTSTRGALPGYKFKCVVPTAPGSSVTAIADDKGVFSLPFPASNLAFGCFVLTPSETQIATVYFTSNAGNGKGQTIQIGGSAELGNVTVDQTRGTASATLDASIVNGIGGTECPLGIWTGTVGVNSDCGGDTVTSVIWMGKDATGAIVLSHSLNPHKNGTCGVSAFAPTSGKVTYENDTLSYGFNIGHPATVAAEVGSDCKQISLVVTQTGCGVCGSASNLATVCQGNGALTCPTNAFVFKKQE